MKKTLFRLSASCAILFTFIISTSFLSVSKTKARVDDTPFYLRIEMRNGSNSFTDYGDGFSVYQTKADLYVCAYADYECTVPYVVSQNFYFEYREEVATENWTPGPQTPTYTAGSFDIEFPGGESEIQVDDDIPVYISTTLGDPNLSEHVSYNTMVRCANTPSSLKYVGVKTNDGGIPPYNPGYYIKINLPDCNCN
ncbi:hypothetical protein [Niabella hibiscisoli]|uniref:hypothetical protein n=1 Tax=Niabella hibiscisoli TaxID=1825928 RepID=UPI001F102F96|nr:hypothetical protein [Niabella hibiscisoli]MCH5717993.1 hypothetical protein [Niabella hibiscisoli]